jgi:hypothetical protein
MNALTPTLSQPLSTARRGGNAGIRRDTVRVVSACACALF